MNKKTILNILLVVIIVAAGVFIAKDILKKNNLEDVDTIKMLVGKHYQLPDEEPALATITDKTKINSEFLRSAENGDKLLVYKEAKKVILFRPSIDRIIEVGPVSIAPTGTSQ